PERGGGQWGAADLLGGVRSRTVTAAVDQEDRLQVGTRGTHEAKTVPDRRFGDLLVRTYRRVQAKGPGQPALVGTVRGGLFVHVQGGGVILGQDPFLDPAVQQLGRLPITRVTLATELEGECDPGRVVRIGVLKLSGFLRSGDVVGRCQESCDVEFVVDEAV